jgi:hypothetical protein
MTSVSFEGVCDHRVGKYGDAIIYSGRIRRKFSAELRSLAEKAGSREASTLEAASYVGHSCAGIER